MGKTHEHWSLKRTCKEAVKVVEKAKTGKIEVTKGGQDFIVKGLICFRCGQPIYVEPGSIEESTPDGFLWVCAVCGEVDEKGVPDAMLKGWDESEELPLLPLPDDSNVPF